MNTLEKLNNRYGRTNMTGFKLVTALTPIKTVLKHFEMDLKILNSADVEYKSVARVIIRDDVIDICSKDNGTPVSYVFFDDANISPESIRDEIQAICDKHEVLLDEIRL